MNQEINFSIIMPAFNCSSSINRAIQSVLNQTYKKWSLIIINDGSIDGTFFAVKNFLHDQRISLYNFKENQGVASARNYGIKKAKGQVICFLDADDWWDVSKLEEQKKLFDQGEKIVFSPYARVKNNKQYLVKVREEVTSKNFFSSNPIPNLTGSFHRCLLPIKQVNVNHEDYIMWWHLIKKAKIARSTDVKKPLAYYYVSENSISSNKFKAAKWHWVVLRSYFRISFFVAIYYFILYLCRSLCIRVAEFFFSKE